MSEDNYKDVFSILVKHRSLSFLKLCTLSNIGEGQLREILDELEKRALVRITDKGDSFNEIITVREKAFAASRSFSD